ncbi:MAG: hypothetical protein ACTSU9_00675 [Promethearchaeota archaeon]
MKTCDGEAELIALVKELKNSGMGQREVYDAFMEFLGTWEQTMTEQEQNALLNTLDVIAGWCAESRWIWQEYLET